MFGAAIFDWDGVIIDSHDAHEKSWEQLAAEEHLPLPPDHFKRSFGRRNNQIIPEIYGWSEAPQEIERLGARKETLYRQILRDTGLDPLPGVRELLAELRGAQIPCAIGTSTPRINLDFALDLLALREPFTAMVTAEDVSRGKPDPEVFLSAANRLNVAPHHCVVFEDAVFGIEAAKRAGMKAVALTTTHCATDLGLADLIISDLSETNVEKLRQLF